MFIFCAILNAFMFGFFQIWMKNNENQLFTNQLSYQSYYNINEELQEQDKFPICINPQARPGKYDKNTLILLVLCFFAKTLLFDIFVIINMYYGVYRQTSYTSLTAS